MPFGAGHCKYFINLLTIVSPWKSVKKYYKYFIDFLTIVLPWKSVRLIPGPLSQVVSNFPHTTLLRSTSFITGGTWDLRTLSQVSRFFPRNFPSQRAFHLRPFFSFPSRSSDWLLTLLVTFYGCYRWPRWKPKKSRSSPQVYFHNNRNFKVTILFLCIVVGIWASYTIFTLYCYLNYKPMVSEGTHLTGLNPT